MNAKVLNISDMAKVFCKKDNCSPHFGSLFLCTKMFILSGYDLLTCSPELLSEKSTKRALPFSWFWLTICLMRAAASGSLATM